MRFAHADWPMEPGSIESDRGRLSSVYFPPREPARGSVLCIPAFAEDMNRCRSMAAIQARHLAAAGFGCLLFDLFGTGESEGEFEDAAWQTWLADCGAAAGALSARTGHEPVLWGVRAGALLAGELACRHPERFERLLLWQPVVDGKSMLTQFLRIRVANLMDWSLPAESTTTMREQLRAGHSVEVTGYILSPDLALPMDACRLADMHALQGRRVDWFEHAEVEGKPLPVSAQKVISTLSERNTVNAHAFQGEAFWKLWDRAWAPALLSATLASLQP